MPFDPTKPVTNAPNSSAEMRSQLNGLKDLIDAILTITAAQVDSVNTVGLGNPANASVSVIGNTLHFSFELPQGNDDSNGNDGANGSDGAPGEVSQQQLDDAISGTSANTNSVNTLDNTYADTDTEELRQKMNELINALRR